MRVWFGSFGRRLLICSAAAFCLAVAPARGEVTAVSMMNSGSMGTFGGREYTWATGVMEGTVARADGTTGHYSVPVTLYYPDHNANGFGFVDVVNNADFYSFTDARAILGQHIVNYTGNYIFSDFLRTEGFTYLAVQFSRMVTELLGPGYGAIENGEDGYEIMRDAARWLRSMENLQSAGLRPERVGYVIGHGHSHSTSVLNGFLARGENREAGGSLVYDGFLLTGLDPFTCRILNDDDTLQDLPGRPRVPLFTTGSRQCPDLPDDGKVIFLRTQSDVERRGNQTQESEGLRLYDLAGTAHIPEFMRSLRLIGAPRQNPVDWRPVARAMLVHLVAWIVAGREPPPPLYIEGHYRPDGGFDLATDADGNALGGIRLPHLITVLPDGEMAGAPLGVYGGIDARLDAALGYGYAQFGGTFEPFSAEELARRYPSGEVYVDLVRRAAAALLEGGYILREGYDAYVRAADRQIMHSPLAGGVGTAGPR